MTEKLSLPMKTPAFLTAVVVLSLFFNPARAQPLEFSFNNPGNQCYFNYLCFSQHDIYHSNRQPFLFMVGKPGEAPMAIFERDTLHSLPSFANYLFVYLPSRGNTPQSKLQCLEAMASLLTFHFQYGNANLFLQVDDPAITPADIALMRLDKTFRTIRLAAQAPADTVITARPEEVFRETTINYELADAKETDESGNFYIDEAVEAADDADEFAKPRKTYFGKPQTFNYTLTGIIRDKASGEALPFATVQVKGTTMGSTANADGFFTMVKVPSDTSVLVVQYMGYDRTEVFLTPFMPKKNLTIELRQSAYTLKAVSIVGRKEEVVLAGRAEVSSVKMTPRKMEQLPGLGEKDIMRSFQLMPGISAANESSSGLYVRGGTPDQNLVLYDGFTIYHVDHLYGFFSAFNANAIKDVQLYKGGFESRFGGRLSSVTEITGKDGNQKKFNVGGDISLLSLNLFAEVPWGEKFSSVVTFRHSYKGALYDAIFKKFNGSSKQDDQPAMGPGGRQVQEAEATNYFYDLNAKVTYRFSDKDQLSLSLYNGTDKLDNSSDVSASGFGGGGRDFNMNTTDLTRYGNTGTSLRWARRWNGKLIGNTVASYSNYFSDRDRTSERTIEVDDVETTTRMGVIENNDLRDYSLKSDYQWDVSRHSQLQFGFAGTWYDINYSYAQNDTSNVLEKQNQALLATTYLQTRIKLLEDKLLLLPGLRGSFFESTGKLYYEPRFLFSYNLTGKLSLKASAGKYYQFVNRVTREDILSGSRDFWLLSDNSAVPVSSAIHWIAGLSYENNSYLFSAEAYYKELSSITEYSLRFNSSPMGVSYDENFYSGTGMARGLELLAQRKAGNLNGWMSYTLGEARNRFEIYSPGFYPANQDVTHEFKAVGQFRYKRWDFSATWIFATGRPYTAPSGAYTITLLDGTEQEFFTVTEKNSIRLPDYHRLDLAANYKLLKGMKGERKRREIGYIGLSLFNVYNRTNVWYKTFTIEDGSILETNVNYLGLTPNLTLSLKFR